MKYRFTLPDEKPYLIIELLSNVTKSTSLEILDFLIRHERKTGISRFLFDVRQVVSETTPVEDYDLAYNLSTRYGAQHHWKGAVLSDPEDSSHDFIIVTGKNAGYRISRFTSFEEADRWLLKG